MIYYSQFQKRILPMKILFAATVDIHIVNHHLRTIHALHELGHNVDVAANGDYTNPDIHDKFNVCFSKSPTSKDNINAYFFMKQLLKERQYDIISCHTPLSSFFTRLAARSTDSKVIYTAHGFHFYQGAPLINNTVYKTMERIGARYTDTLVTINQEDCHAAKAFTLKPGGEVRYIPGVGVDLADIRNAEISRREARERMGIPWDAFLLFSAGELNKNKNHLFVIRALQDFFHHHPDLHYVICGRDLWNGTYEAVIKELDLERQVHLLGYREDVRSLLYGADAYLSPSFREGLPVSVIEAMSVGLLVIASDVRGNHDLIDSGKDGLLYQVSDSNQFLDCFRQVYENKSLRCSLGNAAKEKAKFYSKEAIDPQIMSLYETKKGNRT